MFSKVGRGERVTGTLELFDLGAYLRTEAPPDRGGSARGGRGGQ